MAIDDDDDEGSEDLPDPIEDLLDAMLTEGKPPLAWVVQWSAQGGDPVAAAWQAARNPSMMVQLIDRYGTLRELRDARVAALRFEGRPISPGWRNAKVAALVRAAVPVPPTLERVLAVGVAPRELDSPVAELVDALDRHGAPDPAWLRDWSRDGADPVTAAWEASQDGGPMAHLLALVRPRALFDLLLEFAAAHEGVARARVPAVLFGPEAPATPAADAWRAALALRWTPRRELPAALRALRAAYEQSPTNARYLVEYPLLSAVHLAADPPPTLPELEAALRAAR